MEWQIGEEDIQRNRWIAAISYIWILFILYWIVDSKFVKFHAKQSLTIFIGEFLLGILNSFLSFLPNYKIYQSIVSLTGLLLFILRIIGFVNAARGKTTKLPLIGDLADRLPL